MTHRNVTARAALLAALTMLGASSARAQLGTASARTLGMADVRTPIARGVDAISANPAGLAMPGSGGFSITLFPVIGGEGASPVTMSDLQRFEGRLVDDATKRLWAQRVRDAGAQHVDAGGDLTWVALTAGRFGFQLSTQAQALGALTPDAVQVLLFGNSGYTGEPTRYSLAGSEFTGMVTHTAAASWAQPILVSGGATRLAIGATVKYVRGAALAHGRETGGVLGASPLELSVQFPVVSTKTSGGFDDNGHGFGLDLGAAWQSGRWRGGVAVQNAFNTFAWDRSRFAYRRGVARFTSDTSSSDFDERAIDQAPASVAEAIDRATFDPTLAAGLAVSLPYALVVAVDVRDRVGDAIAFTPKLHAGVGAEWRGLSWLPLRGGVAKVTDGSLVSGGAGLRLGAVALDAGVSSRTGDGPARRSYGVSLTFGAR